MKVVLLLTFLLLCGLCSSATFNVASKDNMELREVKNLPFTSRRKFLTDSLGVEVEIDWDTSVSLLGMKNIFFGLRFPPCTSKFEAYIDLRDWNLPKLSKFINIEIPKVCASDLGLSIPYSQLCLSVKDISIMRRSVVASVYADMTVGASFFQMREDSILLAQFSIGNVSTCVFQTKQDACVSNGCGWCAETQKCLEKRSDNRADTCLFCNRCQYYTTNNQKAECMSKVSCGWCETDSTCYSGDNLGPFNRSSACIPASFTGNTEFAEIEQQPATQWNYNTPVPAEEVSGQIALAVFISLAIGFIIGATLLSLVYFIPLIVYCARAKVSPKEYFQHIFAKPQSTSSSSFKDKKEKLLI